MLRIFRVLLLALSCATLPAHATSLRIASGFDPQTMDPHALALLYHTRVSSRVAFGLPAMTRKLAVRLSMPQVGLTGAQKPSTNRL